MRYFILFIALTAFFCPVYAQNASGHIDFVLNKGQWPAQVQYRAAISTGAVFFTANSLTYNFHSSKDAQAVHELRHKGVDIENEIIHYHAYTISFPGAKTNPLISQGNTRSNYYNFFKGNDPSHWAGKVPAYDGIKYQDLFEGIDMNIYSNGTAMEYDFLVKPGADVHKIRMSYEGVSPELLPNGDLRIVTSVNEITESAPVAYQNINGKKVMVSVKFIRQADGSIGFSFPSGYDHTSLLVIDPVLVFATYSGSTGDTYGFSATYDKTGCLYAGGESFDTQWPVSTGSFQMTFGGGVDAGLNKYNPTGTSLIYSTYYGGSGSDVPSNMVTNSADELIVCGSTTSNNLAVTAGCYDPTSNGSADLYVVHFNAAGSALIGATYLGGSSTDGQNSYSLSPNYGDQNRGEVLTDLAGNIFIASSTSSSNFPVTPGAYQTTSGGGQDGCVSKLNSDCSALLFSTFLGGSSEDACFSIVKTTAGALAVCGGTQSTNFPTTAGTLHPTAQGGTDGFVTIINSGGSGILHSTFLGTGVYDHAFKIQADYDDNILVCGQTQGSYPVTPGIYTNPGSGIFIDKLSPDLSTSLRSTVIGQVLTTGNLVPTAFLSDVCGNIYFCGFQAYAGLPLTPDAHQTAPGGFWLCVLRLDMTTLYYATYMGVSGDHVDGGTSRFDPDGIVYHSVCNYSGFPTTPGCWQQADISSSWDVASFKFDFDMNGVRAGIGLGGASDSGCAPYTINFENLSTNAASYLWDFNDGTPTTTVAVPPPHTFNLPGIYHVTLVAYNDDINFCNHSDTAEVTIYIGSNTLQFNNSDTIICIAASPLTVSAPATNYPGAFTYQWLPDPAITSALNAQTVTVVPTGSLTLTVIVSQGTICPASDTATVRVSTGMFGPINVNGDTTICVGDTITLFSSGGALYAWTPAINLEKPFDSITKAWPSQTIQYTVLISDSIGCTESRQVMVTVMDRYWANAGPDEIIRYGQSYQMQASGGGQYLWTPAMTLSSAIDPYAVATPPHTTTYILTVTNSTGQCPTYDTVTIGVTNISVPSAFTPNADAKNDEFRPVIMNQLVSLNSFKIFDRFGTEVFSTSDVTKGWNGTYHDAAAAEIGTYFYLLVYHIGPQEFTEKGDLELIR